MVKNTTSTGTLNRDLEKIMRPGYTSGLPGEGGGEKKMGKSQKLIMASSAAAGSVWRAPRAGTGKRRGGI